MVLASYRRALGWGRRKGHRLAEYFDTRFSLVRMLTEVPPVLPPAVLPLIQPQHVAGHVMQARTLSQFLLNVGQHGVNRGFTIRADWVIGAKQPRIDVTK